MSARAMNKYVFAFQYHVFQTETQGFQIGVGSAGAHIDNREMDELALCEMLGICWESILHVAVFLLCIQADEMGDAALSQCGDADRICWVSANGEETGNQDVGIVGGTSVIGMETMVDVSKLFVGIANPIL